MLTVRSLGAQVPLDTARQLAKIAAEAARIGAERGESIWPGFRPDTIPLSFVLPSRGDLIFGWRGALPPGYVAVAGLPTVAWRDQQALSAASSAVQLEGRRVAQVVVGRMDPAMLAATALHEAFHVFEAASQRSGRKFGQGENSMLVSSYPVFDVENERAFALEGKVLAAAMREESVGRKRRLAQEFVAVRQARHRALRDEFSTFEQMSELNEGLAEYALVRALQSVAREGPLDWRAGAARALTSRVALLDDVTGSENLSLRFRFYQTGPAEALLMDALAAPGWKARLLAGNATLQDALAEASGLEDLAIAAHRRAELRARSSDLRTLAARRVALLEKARRAKVVSLLSQPGLRLVLSADSLPNRQFNPCGYDPQNLLQVTPTVRIQMRWWKPCGGGPTNAEFNVPSVYDETAGTVSAIIGSGAEVKLTSNGQPLVVRDGETLHDLRSFRLDAPRASVQAVRADITRQGSTLVVRAKTQ